MAKSTKKTAVKPDEYSQKKLDVVNRCKIGTSYTYHGRNTAIDGRSVKVVGHEQRAGGVYVEFKGTRYTVSPFSLLDITANGNEKPNATPTKGTAKAKAKSKATAKQPATPATKPTPAPTPAKVDSKAA